jgi:hypothetical protein
MGPSSLGVKVRVKLDDFRSSVFKVDRKTLSELSKYSWRFRKLITISPAALLQRWRKSTTARHALAVAGMTN